LAQVNPLTRELLVKLVYYGPGLGGKTTSLQRIHQASPPETRGQIVSLATPVDRTLYFDFLPLRAASVRGHHVRLQLFTVPGQVYFNATRKLVLTGADGVVFVADSQRERHDANLESLENLAANLETHGRSLGEIPLVLQYNKRDLPNIMDMEEMDASLNEFGAPAFPTCAAGGEGVLSALDALVQAVMDDLEGRQLLGAEPKPRSDPKFYQAEEMLEDQIGRASAEVWRVDDARGVPTDLPPRPAFSTEDEQLDHDDLVDEERFSRVTYTRDAKTEFPPPRRPSEAPVLRVVPQTNALAGGGPSWAPLFGGEAAGVRLVELDLAEGRIGEAVARLDGLVQRALRDVADALELPETNRQGALVASLIGVDPVRWVRFRAVCARARAEEPIRSSEALSALALLIEIHERQTALRSEA
jgi:signal recognition particle receptor subunit beta